MKNRVMAGILSVIMISYMVFAIIPPVFAIGNTVTISSKEDFINFAKNCTIDTWSDGKTVNLTCDIDFTDGGFSSVPTFGGTFNGNGYTISGIDFSKDGSYMGIFRYVRENGKVTNLNVSAAFTPNGSKSFIGGIAGENHGVLELCGFDGTVKGKNVIGGIAGSNEDTGQIISCSSSGSITGENSTGGIAGKNSGFIQNCTNNALVNTVYEEKKKDISNIDTDTGAIIENYKNNAEETEEDSVLGHTDTGGIVGYSSGVVQGCVNNANIGYRHIGYNVGGISGRQSGYMLGCKNYGFIQGRKDAGGIAGQTEPYILLQTSENDLQSISQELDNLNVMVNKFITDTDNLGDDTEQHFTNISEYFKNAKDSTEIMLNHGTDFIDDNLGEINAQAAILSNTFDKLSPVFENLESGSENLSTAIEDISKTLDNINIYAPDLSKDINNISSVLSDMSRAEKSINDSSTKFRKAINDLNNAIKYKNETEAKKAMSALSTSIKDIITAKQTIEKSLDTIENILKTRPESFEGIGLNAKEIAENIKVIKDNISTIISSLQVIKDSLDTITLNTEINFLKLQAAAGNMASAIRYLSDALYYITDGLDDLGKSIKSMSDKLNDYADDVSEEINTTKDNLSDNITSLTYAADDITAALEDIKDIITDLSNEDSLEFVKLGDDFKTASEDLFNSISDISGEIEALKDTVSEDKSTITNNLTSISNQFDLVLNLLIDKFENLKDETTNTSDRFLDASDEDIEHTKQGKIAECHNFGRVEADRNTGGISGAMAIEYSKDPEDDIEKPDTLNFTYRTKAILQECINDGEIIGKKDCTGGIVGLSEIGTVYECQNYADIESTNGNYVGGIAGKSDSSIRKSYAKSKLTGKRYIGGIAGKADIITACHTIVNVSGDENTGAICGDTKDLNKMYKNFYVDNGLGAVDGISYSEKAMPVNFEELQSVSNIPARFISFTVTFIADDKVIETQEIKYGSEIARIKYPPIPKKDGHFGHWLPTESDIVTENIEILCEYQPYITIISSEEKNDNGKLSLVLAEGEFTDKAQIHISDSTENPPTDADGNVKVYDISLFNTDIEDADTVTIRLLNENKDKVTAHILKNGNWIEAKVSSRGKYVILQMTGTRGTICLNYTDKNYNVIRIISGLIIVLIVLLLIFKIKAKKAKKKPAAIQAVTEHKE